MSDQSTPTRSPMIRLLLVLLPLAAMLGAFIWIASLDPLRSFNNGAPPVEALTVVPDASAMLLQTPTSKMQARPSAHWMPAMPLHISPAAATGRLASAAGGASAACLAVV